MKKNKKNIEENLIETTSIEDKEKALEQTRQLEDLKKVLEFDEDKKKKRKRKTVETEIPYVAEIEKTLKMKKITEEDLKKEFKLHKVFSILFLITTAIATILLGINFKNFVNIYFLLVNVLILLIVAIFLNATNFTKKNIFNVFTSISAIILIVFNALTISSIVTLPTNETLPSFVDQNIGDVLAYTTDNDIELITNYEHSDLVSEYGIITQDIKEGTLLKDVDTLTVLVSSGANTDKLVTIPNMIGYDLDKVIKTIEENFLTNVTIDFVIDENIAKNTVISQDKTGDIRRNEELKIVISLGTADEITSVEMIDLKSLSLFDATLWLKQHNIAYELVYEFSDSVNRDYVLSQNEQVGTLIDPSINKITLIVSKGDEIVIPNFNQMTVDEATKWIIENKLKVEFIEQYDNEYKQGSIIISNYELNSVVEEGTLISLTISKGPLKLEQFDTIFDFRTWADSFSLTYEETEEYSDTLASGQIISITPEFGSNLSTDEVIKVVVSKGKAVTVPNFYNMSVANIKTSCTNEGLKCSFSYRYHNTVASGLSYSQSMKATSVVPEGTSVVIYISNGVEPVTPPVVTPEPEVPTCNSTQTHTLYIQSNWITGGSSASTINILKTKFAASYPNVTFNFVTQSSNLNPGFIHENSPISSGSQIQDCNTYTIIIVE